jgi:hypothetical protein
MRHFEGEEEHYIPTYKMSRSQKPKRNKRTEESEFETHINSFVFLNERPVTG